MTETLRPATWPSSTPFNLSEIDHEAQRFCVEMHKNGIYVDQDIRANLEILVTGRYKKREKILVDIMRGMGLSETAVKTITSDDSPDEDDDEDNSNPGSCDQIRDILYRKWDLGIPVGLSDKDFFTKSGLEGTGDKVLRAHLASPRLTDAQRSFINELRLYRREKNKILGTTLIPMQRRRDHRRGLAWDDGRIRSTWNSHTVANARLSSSKPNCFTGDTEILTTEGWIRFDELPEGLSVAQWHEDGTIDFVEPTGYVSHFADNVINILSPRQIDLAVTADHRCLLRSYRDERLFVVPASDYSGFARQIQAGEADGKYHPGDDLLRLVVATQADGSFQGNTIRFGFTKRRKIDRLDTILRGLGYPVEWRVRPDGAYECYIRGALSDRVRGLLDEKKRFKPWPLMLGRRELQLFADEVLLWDGCQSRGHQKYYSVEKVNVDIAQAVFALVGRRSTVRGTERPGRQTLWTIIVDKKGHATTQYHRKIPLPPQQVYCVSVPSSYVLVRRNGKMAVTGNCQNIGSRKSGFLKTLYAAAPGHILLGADLSQAHLYITANYWRIKSQLEAFANGFDPHILLAAEVVRQAGGDYASMDGWEPVGGYDRKRKPKKGSQAFAMRELCKTMKYSGIYGAGVTLKGHGRVFFKPDTLAAVVRSTETPVLDAAGKDTGNVALPYLGFSDDQVIAFHRAWMESEPDWIAAWEYEMARFEAQGWVDDPVFLRRSGGLSDGKFNEVVNYPILTAEAHIMRLAEWNVRQAFPFEFAGAGTGPIQQVHDQIVVEIPLPQGFDPLWAPTKGEPLPPELERQQKLLEECMQIRIPGWELAIPAEGGCGRSLADV